MSSQQHNSWLGDYELMARSEIYICCPLTRIINIKYQLEINDEDDTINVMYDELLHRS